MSDIGPVEDPAVWTSRTVSGKEGFLHRVEVAHLEGLQELLDRTRHLGLEDIRRDHFDHPAVNELMDGVRQALMNGRGAAILTGIDMARFGVEEYRRLCWGLGDGLRARERPSRDRLHEARHVQAGHRAECTHRRPKTRGAVECLGDSERARREPRAGEDHRCSKP